jgi:hypothetical protein
MTTIFANLQAVRSRIVAAAHKAGRDPKEIRFLAVSKAWPAETVREAASAGQREFGENYVKEAVEKVTALADLRLEWHFIGPLQSNKTRAVAECFTWVHSVDRLKIAQRLSEARGTVYPPLQVCIQVNVSGESTKYGIAPNDLPALAQSVAALPSLRLRGLMAIPEPSHDMELLRNRFASVRFLKEDLCRRGMALDTLSMGMSGDLEAAIMEGATIVRVGTAIFGHRRAVWAG